MKKYTTFFSIALMIPYLTEASSEQPAIPLDHSNSKRRRVYYISPYLEQLDMLRTLTENQKELDLLDKLTVLRLARTESSTDLLPIVRAEDYTELHYAAFINDIKLAERLITQEELDVNAQDTLGATPLHYASYGGYYDLAKLFLENDADVNMADKLGRTPLHEAAEQGHEMMVSLLIVYGANISAKTSEGNTPEDLADLKRQKKVKELFREEARLRKKHLKEEEARLREEARLKEEEARLRAARLKEERLRKEAEEREKEEIRRKRNAMDILFEDTLNGNDSDTLPPAKRRRIE